MQQGRTVHVPDLVGLEVGAARNLGHAEGVMVVSAEVDGPPLGALTWPGTWRVTAQHPPVGTEVERRSVVTIDFERAGGGGAGDRVPLRPRPDPPVLHVARRPDE